MVMMMNDTEVAEFMSHVRYIWIWMCPIIMFIVLQALKIDGYVKKRKIAKTQIFEKFKKCDD